MGALLSRYGLLRVIILMSRVLTSILETKSLTITEISESAWISPESRTRIIRKSSKLPQRVGVVEPVPTLPDLCDFAKM